MPKKMPIIGELYTPKTGWHMEPSFAPGDTWTVRREAEVFRVSQNAILSGAAVLCVSVDDRDRPTFLCGTELLTLLSLERFQNGMKLVSESSD